LRNDPEHVLPAYIACSIAKSQRNWADGPAKVEQEKMLKSHWAVLGRLRNAGITLAEVVRQYHAQGVVPLRLCDMTADRAPWVGTVTAPKLPSHTRSLAPRGAGDRECDLLVAASWMLPMLPNAGTEICRLSVFLASFTCLLSWEDLLGFDLGASLLWQLKCAHFVPAKAPLLEEAIFNQN
jgi:hypothetical protein